MKQSPMPRRREPMRRISLKGLQAKCCGKKTWATQEAAEAALLRIQRTTQDETGPVPQRVYECPRGFFHLTSKEKWPEPVRKQGLRPQSKKREAENRLRKKVAYATFGTDPTCSREGCNEPADDCHEPLTRARGGSITDPANMAPLCRKCHDELTNGEPAWAYEQGLLKHSWPGDAA